MQKNQINFYTKPSRLSELLGELVQERPVTIVAVTKDKLPLKLEVVTPKKLATFLSCRSVDRLHLTLGPAPKSKDDWHAITRHPKKQLPIELGHVDETQRTISETSALAFREGPSFDLLTALRKIIVREFCKGVRVRTKAGTIKKMPYFWSPDLEGWMPEGYEFPFEDAT